MVLRGAESERARRGDPAAGEARRGAVGAVVTGRGAPGEAAVGDDHGRAVQGREKQQSGAAELEQRAGPAQRLQQRASAGRKQRAVQWSSVQRQGIRRAALVEWAHGRGRRAAHGRGRSGRRMYLPEHYLAIV